GDDKACEITQSSDGLENGGEPGTGDLHRYDDRINSVLSEIGVHDLGRTDVGHRVRDDTQDPRRARDHWPSLTHLRGIAAAVLDPAVHTSSTMLPLICLSDKLLAYGLRQRFGYS